MTINVGVFTYKLIGYEFPGQNPEDTFTVLPVEISLRYNIHFNPDLSGFVRAGLVYNFVLQAQNATQNAIDRLKFFNPALGIGMHYRMGPHWYLRGDIGIDNLGVGVELRY
jgi:outer membrane protein W